MKDNIIKRRLSYFACLLILFGALEITSIFINIYITWPYQDEELGKYLASQKTSTIESLLLFHRNFAAPWLARCVDLVSQSVLVAIASFILLKWNIIDANHWLRGIVGIVFIHNLMNINARTTPSIIYYVAHIALALVIAIGVTELVRNRQKARRRSRI